jgi:FkbM family methyltransferase
MAGARCGLEYVLRLILNLPSVIRTRSLTPVDRTMGGRQRSFRVFGETIQVAGHLFGGAREIYGRQVYFAVPGFFLSPADVVVDLGANAGLFTTLAGRLARRVIAVEAQSAFIDEIYDNVRANGCAGKVEVEFGIVGGRTGRLSDRRRLEEASHYRLAPPPLTMEEIFARHEIEAVDFLKVDIEGSEFGLLDGPLGWLRSVRRAVLEVHREFGEPAQVLATLRREGFQGWLVDNDGRAVDRIVDQSGYVFARRGGLP